MDILPGEISDPHWDGNRCSGCGRPLGEGFVRCSDYAEEGLPPKPHLTIESIPAEVKLRWFTDRAWDNAQRMIGTLNAVEWLCTGHPSLNGARPVDLVRADKGMAVLELQHAEWPLLQREAAAAKDRQRRAA